MAWVKIDDNAPHHRKQLAAGPVACWLWVCGLAYANRHSTDGVIPGEALPYLGCSGWQKAAPRLVEVGLWRVSEANYVIHDFLAWNDSAESRRAKTAESNERVQRYRERMKRDGNTVTPLPVGNACNATPQPTPIPTPQPQPQPQPELSASKNDAERVRGGGLLMSPGEFARKRDKNRHVGARLLVPNVLHAELMTKLGGENPDSALAAWYATLDAEVEASREPIVDVFKWIRPKFEAWATSQAEDAAFREALRVAVELDAADAARKVRR